MRARFQFPSLFFFLRYRLYYLNAGPWGGRLRRPPYQSSIPRLVLSHLSHARINEAWQEHNVAAYLIKYLLQVSRKDVMVTSKR